MNRHKYPDKKDEKKHSYLRNKNNIMSENDTYSSFGSSSSEPSSSESSSSESSSSESSSSESSSSESSSSESSSGSFNTVATAVYTGPSTPNLPNGNATPQEKAIMEKEK